MDNLDAFSIFTESTEDMGIMFGSYEPILGITISFLDIIEKCTSDLKKKPLDVDIDLDAKIAEYKKSVSVKFKAEAIDIRKINQTIKKIRSFNDDLDKLLSRYTKLKDSIAFGGNYLRAIVNRPKVYSKDIDEKKYDRVNKNVRNVNRAMDWIEKIIIDLFNMADQDLNILTIVDRVYAKKHIYESGELPAGVQTEDVADSVIAMLPGAKDPKAITEAPWLVNTRDKKTGSAATYISRNHDMANYGEDDGEPPKKEEEPAQEPTLDDYRRPSADGGNNHSSVDDDSNPDDANSDKVPSGVQNYYYYTYNNSLNKNSNSFNKDHSIHDDHSHRADDHSSGKMINSNNTANSHNNTADKNDHEKEKEFRSLESAKPWELNFGSKVYTEEVGDADDNKPTSDNPIQDTMMDIDRELMKGQQKAKKAVQKIQNAGRAIMKPINRTKDWIGNMVGKWKDADETNIKERLADPHARTNLFTAIKKAVTIGSLVKAGLLLNPVFLFLTVTRGIGKNKKEFRIRNEMIGEIKTEIEIVERKIEDADRNGDNKAKYQLMRFKNELNKKLMRVGGGKGWSKII